MTTDACTSSEATVAAGYVFLLETRQLSSLADMIDLCALARAQVFRGGSRDISASPPDYGRRPYTGW